MPSAWVGFVTLVLCGDVTCTLTLDCYFTNPSYETVS